MEIKDKLLLIRAKLNMSQEALARELNVSYATINRWETGRTKPSQRYIMLINNYIKEKGIQSND